MTTVKVKAESGPRNAFIQRGSGMRFYRWQGLMGMHWLRTSSLPFVGLKSGIEPERFLHLLA